MLHTATYFGFFLLRPKVGLAAYLTGHRNSRARHQIRELRPGTLTNRGSTKHFKSFLILCYLVLLLFFLRFCHSGVTLQWLFIKSIGRVLMLAVIADLELPLLSPYFQEL